MPKVCLIIVTLFLLLTNNSCKTTGSVAKKITIKSGQIPPDMASADFTIIGLLRERRSYDKYLRKEFEAYTGKYVLATFDEMSSTYSDKEKYRYYMDYDIEERPHFSNGSYSTSTAYVYFLFDRKNGQKYKRKRGSGFFALEMKAYLKAIETARKK